MVGQTRSTREQCNPSGWSGTTNVCNRLQATLVLQKISLDERVLSHTGYRSKWLQTFHRIWRSRGPSGNEPRHGTKDNKRGNGAITPNNGVQRPFFSANFYSTPLLTGVFIFSPHYTETRSDEFLHLLIVARASSLVSCVLANREDVRPRGYQRVNRIKIHIYMYIVDGSDTARL